MMYPGGKWRSASHTVIVSGKDGAGMPVYTEIINIHSQSDWEGEIGIATRNSLGTKNKLSIHLADFAADERASPPWWFFDQLRTKKDEPKKFSSKRYNHNLSVREIGSNFHHKILQG